jgi:hypothetical protein
VEVKLVALKAEEGLILLEKVIGNGPVSTVTDSAVFHNRGMLKDKGPLLGSMAGQTKIIQPFVCFEATDHGTVWIMAV